MTIQKALEKAIEHHQNNEFTEADKLYTAVLQTDPNNPDANHNLGVLAVQLNKLEIALPLFEKAFNINPKHEQYQKSYTNSKTKFENYITKLFNEKKYEEALQLTQAIVEKLPNYAFSWKVIGSIQVIFKDYDNALTSLQKALELNPDDEVIYNSLGKLYKDTGKINEAILNYQKAIELDPNYAKAYNNLGSALKDIGKIEEAKVSYNKAIELNPNYPDALYNLGITWSDLGNLKEAEVSYRKVIELNPNYAHAHRLLSALIKYSPDTPHLQQLLELYPITKINSDKCHLGFALAKAYEDLKDYDKSFFYLNEANCLHFKDLNYDISVEKNNFKLIKSLFINNCRPNKEIAIYDKQAIFIVGMPRSGTSLTEQIISSHPHVYGCGELDYLANSLSKYKINVKNLYSLLKKIAQDYISDIEKMNFNEIIFTDKMPHNFKYIGFILEAFPNAKIIHVQRDPMAICWSMYKNYFPAEELAYCYNINTLVEFYNLYKDIMDFWNQKYPNKIYNLEYETLTENQEKETRKLLEYCELFWEDSVLQPEKNNRAVKTASNQQIRKKVYKGSSQEWKKYEKHLVSLQTMIKSINKTNI
jgi:tetratricopeptide (TPR) repeat protein